MKKFAILVCALLLAALPSFAEACDSAAHGGEHAKACPMKGKKVSGSSDVELTGKLVCTSCDLHKEGPCNKVFQSSKDKSVFELCPMSDEKAIDALSEHGDALFVVNGKVVKADDGSMAIEIKSAKKTG